MEYEFVPLLGVMVVTIAVMAGLLLIFKRWVARRDKLMEDKE